MHEESACRATPRRSRLGVALSVLFALALIMGPGPGLYLVNPDPSDPQSATAIAGVPILYAWALGWFALQAAVVLTAYFTLWKSEPAASNC